MKIPGIILLTIILIQPAHADWKESLNNAWDNTKDLSNETLDKSKDLYSTLSGDVRLIPKSERQTISQQIILEEKNKHLKNIWPDVLKTLDDALSINTRIDYAPDSAWFSDDKKSLSQEQFEVFSEIEKLLASPTISKNRKNIDRLKDKIKEQRHDIASLKEKRIVATTDESAELDKKISNAHENITVYLNNIEYQKNKLRARLQEMGLSLNYEQIGVLLSRVDSDDIIKMSVIYDVLADITKQLMGLTKEFDEDINQARKYYGMHVVLLKMVITMQQSYINKLDKQYLPKIAKIKQDTLRVNQESRSLLQSEKKSAQRQVLQNNLKAQQLTLKVAMLYSEQLLKQK